LNQDWSNEKDPLVVTGLGLVSPLGVGKAATWSRLIAGESAIRANGENLEASVINFSPNGARSRMGDFALLAAEEALKEARLFNADQKQSLRIGCCVSQSKPLIGTHHGLELDPALLLSEYFGWSASSLIPRYFSLSGPLTNVVAACATGLASLKVAEQWLNQNSCDVVLAGAAESSLNDFYRAGFHQMGVLADGPDPRAVCPFDQKRTGFAMGEGAAVLVLEKLSHAKKRKAAPLAVLARVVLQQSPLDILRFDEDGGSVARLLKSLMPEGELPGAINAHGTGTRINDRAETRGIKKNFGSAAQDIPISSTKAATGHLLGAAGALESALAVLSLRDGIIPPTLHLKHPDPECDLDYVSDGTRRRELKSTVSLSYGFGGQMGGVLFKKYDLGSLPLGGELLGGSENIPHNSPRGGDIGR
jgi:3-oxoacyl-[acyl-carrier-protein] synthase II